MLAIGWYGGKAMERFFESPKKGGPSEPIESAKPETPKFTQRLDESPMTDQASSKSKVSDQLPQEGPEAPASTLDPTWEQRVAKIVRERPTTRCPDCGSDYVIYYFNFKPSDEEWQATEPYKDFIHFGYNQGCCWPSPGTPRVLEEWTCRQCGENWDEVFATSKRPVPKAVPAREGSSPDTREIEVKGQPTPKPMLDPNLPEYPTESQMDTMFNAYLNGGEAGILAALEAARQKREPDRAYYRILVKDEGKG